MGKGEKEKLEKGKSGKENDEIKMGKGNGGKRNG